MEQIAPIILLILWLIVSFLNNKKKPAAPQKAAPRPETTSLPADSELKEMLEDFFGGDDEKQSKKMGQPANKTSKPDYSEEVDNSPEIVYQQTYENRSESESQRELVDNPYYEMKQEESEPHTFEHQSYETVVDKAFTYDQLPTTFEYNENIFDTTPVSLETLQTSMPEYKDLSRQEIVEEAEVADKRILKEFNLRDAVIFSEILNRRYS